MLIVCPSCASRYELDGAKLGPAGKKVRCASCQTLWHVEAEVEVFPEAPDPDETRALLDEELRRASEIDAQVSAIASEQVDSGNEDADMPVLPPDPVPRKRRKGYALPGRAGSRPVAGQSGARRPAMIALGGVLCLAVLVWQREPAVRIAPQLASVFEKLGAPVNVRRLNLSGVESKVIEDAQGRILVVEGDVTNIGGSVTKVPLIELAVQDAGGQTLYTWTTEPPRGSLEPSELVHFRARLTTPPDAGQNIRVRFTDAKPTGLASAH